MVNFLDFMTYLIVFFGCIGLYMMVAGLLKEYGGKFGEFIAKIMFYILVAAYFIWAASSVFI